MRLGETLRDNTLTFQPRVVMPRGMTAGLTLCRNSSIPSFVKTAPAGILTLHVAPKESTARASPRFSVALHNTHLAGSNCWRC